MLSGSGAGHRQCTEDENRHLTLPTLPRIVEDYTNDVEHTKQFKTAEEGGGGSVCCPSYSEGEEGSIARHWSSPFW